MAQLSGQGENVRCCELEPRATGLKGLAWSLYRMDNQFMAWCRRLVQQHVDVLSLRKARWIGKDRYAHDAPASTYESEYPYVLGIVKEFWHQHWPYVAACRDMRVAYKIVDISGPDWINAVRDAGCDAFLVWPSVALGIWKRMVDDRLRFISGELGKIMCPTAEEIWLYESKYRNAYWLQTVRLPHPRTWVFYDIEQALGFVEGADLPLVFKPDRGSGAQGIRIFRDRSKLARYVKRYFHKGHLRHRDDWRDLQWGSVLLQEYVGDADEWRVIRLGSSFFAYKKGKIGDFHSGSHYVIFADPPAQLLDLALMATECGHFTSISLDIFELPDGRYLINELHPVFGRDPWDHSMEVNGEAGRYYRNPETGEWVFEKGVFTENSGCNLRVKMVLDQLADESLPIVYTHRE